MKNTIVGYLDYQIPDSIAGRNLQNQYILVTVLGCLWTLEWAGSLLK